MRTALGVAVGLGLALGVLHPGIAVGLGGSSENHSNIQMVYAQAQPAEETTEFVITTAPVLAGIEVELDGVVKETGPAGIIVFDVPKVDNRTDTDVSSRINILTEEVAIDEGSRAHLSLVRPGSKSMIIQFTIDYLISFTYRDSSGRRVPADELDEMVIKSSVGEVVPGIKPGTPLWLLGKRSAPSSTGMEDKQVFWSIQDVMVSGSSVANRSQTKFYPEIDREIVVPLLFFSASFEVIDAFFGYLIGDSLELTAPDGSVSIVLLVDGRARLEQVPRGEYVVTVLGPGLRLERPVAITRNQAVPLKLYSWLDLGVVATVLSTFTIAPIAYGVRRRKRILMRERLADPASAKPRADDTTPDRATVPPRDRPKWPTARPGEVRDSTSAKDNAP